MRLCDERKPPCAISANEDWSCTDDTPLRHHQDFNRDDQNPLWAVGVYRKRDRKIIHSLCLIFTTFVLISLSVHRPCAGGAYPWVNEGISWLTHRRGAPFLHTPSISAPRNVRQLIPMAQPDFDAAPMRGRPLDGRIHHPRPLGCAVSWEH